MAHIHAQRVQMYRRSSHPYTHRWPEMVHAVESKEVDEDECEVKYLCARVRVFILNICIALLVHYSLGTDAAVVATVPAVAGSVPNVR